MTKIVVFALIFVAIWFLFFRKTRAGKPPAKRMARIEDLIRCPKCGAFRSQKLACTCGDE